MRTTSIHMAAYMLDYRVLGLRLYRFRACGVKGPNKEQHIPLRIWESLEALM